MCGVSYFLPTKPCLGFMSVGVVNASPGQTQRGIEDDRAGSIKLSGLGVYAFGIGVKGLGFRIYAFGFGALCPCMYGSVSH